MTLLCATGKVLFSTSLTPHPSSLRPHKRWHHNSSVFKYLHHHRSAKSMPLFRTGYFFDPLSNGIVDVTSWKEARHNEHKERPAGGLGAAEAHSRPCLFWVRFYDLSQSGLGDIRVGKQEVRSQKTCHPCDGTAVGYPICTSYWLSNESKWLQLSEIPFSHL